jgi:hypothetical protein
MALVAGGIRRGHAYHLLNNGSIAVSGLRYAIGLLMRSRLFARFWVRSSFNAMRLSGVKLKWIFA